MENPNHDGLRYITVQCNTCHARFAKCLPCGAVYAIPKRNHRNIKEHMLSHPQEQEIEINDFPNDDFSLGDSLPSILDDGSHNLSTSQSSDIQSNGIQSTTSSLLFSNEEELDNSNTFDDPFSLDNLSISSTELPIFDNNISNEYFHQDFNVYSRFG